MSTRKVLYSPGYGDGWSSGSPYHGRELATDPVLVFLASRGRVLIGKYAITKAPSEYVHPDFLDRLREICGDNLPHLSALTTLRIEEVGGPFYVSEFEGDERVHTSTYPGARCPGEGWW